ncbi:MAG: hypothetical protein R3F43_16910, partial [bacterium]
MADTLEKFAAVPTSQKVALLIFIMVGIGAAWYFLMYEEAVAKIGTENQRVPVLQKELSEERDVADHLEERRNEI